MQRLPSPEPLEARIAPASVSITYIDIDDDLVNITASTSGPNAPPLDLNDLAFTDGNPDGQLATLNLSASGFQDASIAFAVTKKGSGDGLAHVGRINATGRDLGTVTVKGDLGVIDAGTGNVAVKLLSVRSMGVFGLSTQAAGADLTSDVVGELTALKVTGDVNGVFLQLADPGPNSRIGSITIGGSLIGGAADFSGSIQARGDIGPVKIGHDIIGGMGSQSGRIQSDLGAIGSVTLGGSLIGGSAPLSGVIRSSHDLGPVKITGDVRGGAGSASGAIASSVGIGTDNGAIKSFTLGGSLLGGAGGESALLRSSGDMGPVKIGREVRGGSGGDSAKIDSGGALASVTVGGSVVAGGGMYNTYTDGNGIKHEGQIFSKLDMGPVKIGRDLVGSVGDHGGTIHSRFDLLSVTIGGSVLGGAGTNSGKIDADGGMGAVKIGGSVVGSGVASGFIVGSGIASVTIGGSLVAGSGNFSGGIAGGPILGPLKIGGDLIGPDNSSSVTIEGGAKIGAGKIVSISIGGSMIAGTMTGTGGFLSCCAIRAQEIGAITVKGSILGNATHSVLITAIGQTNLAPNATTDVAIKSLTVGGRVDHALILGGYNTFNAPAVVNGNASIGAVSVGGDWIASSLTAGVKPSNDTGIGHFGNSDDQPAPGRTLIARIASISIKGIVAGSAASGDHFGFVSQQIGSFKSFGFTAPLTSGNDPDIELSLSSGDVTIREV